jgi:cytoskeletal protein RodZ
MTNESSNETEHPKQQPMEQAPEQAPKGEVWMKDYKETGRWGVRSRREVVCVLVLILLMIIATVTGVFVAWKNANKKPPMSTEPVGITKIDPVTGNVVSAYELPKKPEPVIVSDQEELDMILNALSTNKILAEKVSIVPNTVAALSAASGDDADPFVKAAAWVTSVDSTNVQQNVIARFALAVMFHTTNGGSWKNATNWL